MTKIINIVFDIDDTLATAFEVSLDELEKWKEENPWVKIFIENNLYIEAIYPHIIHPGVPELIQLLDKMLDVRISFFSSYDEKRNKLFVEKLLTQVLGSKRYNEIKDKITVCSKQHCLRPSKEERSFQKKNYFRYFYGAVKKNLEAAGISKEELPNAVLIEDDLGYAFPGQEKNLLKILDGEEDDFSMTYKNFKEKRHYSHFSEDDWQCFYRANNIFYAAGLLFCAMDIVIKEAKKLCDVLSNIQLQTVKEVLHYRYEITQNLNFYEKGLTKLREINPKLNFLSSENFLHLSNVATTPVENIISNGIYQKPLTEEMSLNKLNLR